MIQFLSADLMGITIYDIIIKITLGYLVIHSSFLFAENCFENKEKALLACKGLIAEKAD